MALLQKLKQTLAAEFNNEEKFVANMRLLKAVAIFAGGIVLMRNFGDLMAT